MLEGRSALERRFNVAYILNEAHKDDLQRRLDARRDGPGAGSP